MEQDFIYEFLKEASGSAAGVIIVGFILWKRITHIEKTLIEMKINLTKLETEIIVLTRICRPGKKP